MLQRELTFAVQFAAMNCDYIITFSCGGSHLHCLGVISEFIL